MTRGPQSGSVQLPNEYKIRTTPVPAGPHGADWLGYFNAKMSVSQFFATHDGSKITAECRPDDLPKLIETVDAAIEYANERVKAG